MGGERRFDFSEFDAKAPDLDLMIETSEKLEVAVGAIADQVAGLVEAGAGDVTEGVGNESFGGEFRPVQIAAGQAHPADVQLAGNADRRRLVVAVENVKLRVGDRTADGHRRPGQRLGNVVKRRCDRGFGSAVGVQKRAAPAGPAGPNREAPLWPAPRPPRMIRRSGGQDRLRQDADQS